MGEGHEVQVEFGQAEDYKEGILGGGNSMIEGPKVGKSPRTYRVGLCQFLQEADSEIELGTQEMY